MHSLLGLVIYDKDSSERHAKLSKYGPRSKRGILIKAISLLIIDVASMMQRVLFEHVQTILKDLRCTGQSSSTRSKPYFGGLTVVLAGDYMQLLPVVPSLKLDVDSSGEARHIPVNLLDEIPWRSTLWEKVKTLRISHPIRQADDRQFSDLLKRIGKGRFPQEEKLPLKSTGSPEEAYKFIWKWKRTLDRRDVTLDRLVMASTNNLVNEHNEKALESFPGQQFELLSATKVQPIRRQGSSGRSAPIITPELTYSYAPTGVPPHKIQLKVGAPVMVIRNVRHPDLLNGKMFVVKRHITRLLEVVEVDENGAGRSSHMLHRIDFQFAFSDMKVTRRQFPVRLAFSATVHKGQGQTLGKLFVDLRSNFFSPGQLYVALLRVRKSSDILLLHQEDDTPIRCRPVHEMPVAVDNPPLKESIDFVEGRVRF